MPKPSTAGPRWVGVVLTGGRSTRMGQDKAFVEVEDRPMVARVAGALHEAGATEVVCVGGDLSRLRSLGLRAEADPRQGSGPLGGIVSALEAVAGSSDAVLVVACDLPWLEARTVAALVATLGAKPDLDVVSARTDRPEPLCAAWRPRVLDALRASFEQGERAVHRAWSSLRRAEVAVDAGQLRDVDGPEDLPAPG